MPLLLPTRGATLYAVIMGRCRQQAQLRSARDCSGSSAAQLGRATRLFIAVTAVQGVILVQMRWQCTSLGLAAGK